MKLEQELAAFRVDSARKAPSGSSALYEAKIEELRASFTREKSIGLNAVGPDFDLPNASGNRVLLSDLRRSGPVVLTFYRGGWCPYCNIQLRAYQSILPEIVELGGRLVAVSPQRPDGSLSTAEMNALTYEILSDVGNEVARSYGIVYSLPEELREVLRENGKALPAIKGDENWELPIPATYVIAKDGHVRLAFLDADYRKRLEPDAILAALRLAGA
jgi:peroxiredoxin